MIPPSLRLFWATDAERQGADGGTAQRVAPQDPAGQAYAAGGWNGVALRGLDPQRVDPWLGTRYDTPMELVNAVFRQGVEHKFAYDGETLVGLLDRHGFRAAVTRFRASALEELAIDSPDRESESLYVEARR